jgi:hypothetical protein
MTKIDHHRTALACMVGGSHTGGCFHWRCFLRIYTCYSWLHWRWFGTCHLLIAQRGHLGSCMFQVLTRPRVGTLLFHMLVFYWHTCRVCGWVTCHFLIGPNVVFLLVHVASIECPHLCRFLRRPSVGLGVVPISA